MSYAHYVHHPPISPANAKEWDAQGSMLHTSTSTVRHILAEWSVWALDHDQRPSRTGGKGPVRSKEYYISVMGWLATNTRRSPLSSVGPCKR